MITSEGDAIEYVRSKFGDRAEAKLKELTALLKTENVRQNLVSPATIASVWQRHIADSAQLLEHVPRETPRWIDLGSGAGFPGLVIALCSPNIEVNLVESRKLRIEWLNRAINMLHCSNCTVTGRDVGTIEAASYDVISARAFAPMPRLVELAARFSTPQTLWLLPKGRSASQDIAKLKPYQRSMFHVKPSLTDPDAKIVIGTGMAEIPR